MSQLLYTTLVAGRNGATLEQKMQTGAVVERRPGFTTAMRRQQRSGAASGSTNYRSLTGNRTRQKHLSKSQLAGN
jgi:hypothetical protein